MTITEELDALDTKIRRLKQEYEQYFMRILKREPLNLKKEIERLILHYTNMTIKSTADQFKLTCLLSRFNSYRQYWVRTLRAIEEGVYVRRAESGPISAPLSSRDFAGISSAQAVEQAWSPSKEAAEDLSSLYNDYIEARKRNNVAVKGLSSEKFMKSIKSARERIARNYNVSDTDVTLVEKDGEVKLVIKPAGVKVE